MRMKTNSNMTNKTTKKNKKCESVVFCTDEYQIVQEADGQLAYRFFDIQPASMEDLAEKGIELGILPAEKAR